MSSFRQDVDRDARLVLAAMQGRFEPQAMAEGLTPDEAMVHHPKWLKAQPAAYLNRVVDATASLEPRNAQRS